MVHLIEPVVHNFRRKLSDVLFFQFFVGNYFISLLQKSITFSQVFDKKCRPVFKLNVFNFEK